MYIILAINPTRKMVKQAWKKRMRVRNKIMQTRNKANNNKQNHELTTEKKRQNNIFDNFFIFSLYVNINLILR